VICSHAPAVGGTISRIFTLAMLLVVSSQPTMAQNEKETNRAAAWLAHAPLPPPFQPGPSRGDWQKQRLEIRSRLWELLGKLPPRPSVPTIEITAREDKGDYFLEKFRFDNGAGSVVPGYLLVPKGLAGKAPAILYCHWHGGEYDIGKEELLQAKHTPEPPGPALAKRGYVVLGVDAYCFGERNGQGPGAETGRDGEWTASKFNLWVGRTLWGMILRDDLMALDYLISRQEVDPERVGVMGMSMGATRAWWLMALDERIKTGVPICCLTRYQNLIQQDLLKAHGIYYFVPNVLNYFDTEAIVSLIAPRPILFLDGDKDGTSPVDGIRAIESAVRPVYRLYGQESAFQSVIYENQGHLYTPEMWQRTLAWFEGNLKDTGKK
jgi:dienelactone hydrolase